MIRFEELAVSYPGALRPAVADVSFTVPPGKMTAIAGPNGSGKSTLIRALLNRVPHHHGRIMVGGSDAASLPRRELARRVAVVTQREEPAFPLPVREYVALGRHPHVGLWSVSGPRDEEAVDTAMRESGIEPFAARRTDQLSGGEWQRVRIARALAQQAEALVLDEPTTFLDIAHEMALFELLAALASRGRAVLLVSHQLNLVARFAESLVLLHEGRVAAAGPPSEVMRGEILERVYRWPLVVTRDAAVGAPMLVPLRGRRP